MICPGCNSEIRRTYSVASTDEDDYLATCNCPIDWPGALLQIALIAIIIGLVALALWFK